ncbi:protein cornichon homolog 2 isoform X1 [Vombatus ursinus]|uniref:protein cornichon homolog 2 isoform X1 n=1 Tax=Vombatus ursinus TaxID=29139 RepID=UPI000FFDB4D6|nr:protein cornichon homolog 2 isoform X1 [Vombatus ursinus]
MLQSLQSLGDDFSVPGRVALSPDISRSGGGSPGPTPGSCRPLPFSQVFPPPGRRLRGHVRRRLHHERRHPQLLSEGVLVQTRLLPAVLLLLPVQYGLYVGEFLKGEAGQGMNSKNGPDACVPPSPRPFWTAEKSHSPPPPRPPEASPLGEGEGRRGLLSPCPPNCCYGMARPSPHPHFALLRCAAPASVRAAPPEGSREPRRTGALRAPSPYLENLVLGEGCRVLIRFGDN